MLALYVIWYSVQGYMYTGSTLEIGTYVDSHTKNDDFAYEAVPGPIYMYTL